MVTQFQLHVRNWTHCTRCDLHKTRQHVVLSRGKVPCDVLFCAEAPGISEDVIGKPMCGLAGSLFDLILEKSVPEGVSYAITNLIGCIPLDEEGAKNSEPPYDSIRACAPRLQEYVDICKPRLIVCVGTYARDWLDQKSSPKIVSLPPGFPMVAVQHPAAILRMNLAMRGLAVQRCVVNISQAIEEFLGVR